MANVTGNIKAKSANKFGFGIMVNDKWYNSKYEIKAEKGDEVEFDDGGKNYIKGLKVVGKITSDPPEVFSGGAKRSAYSRGAFPIPAGDGQRSIIRQNSVSNAVNLYEALAKTGTTFTTDPIEWVLLTAREFEKYSSGDLDKELSEEIDAQFEIK